MLRAWMQEPVPPRGQLRRAARAAGSPSRPGRRPRRGALRLALGAGGLERAAATGRRAAPRASTAGSTPAPGTRSETPPTCRPTSAREDGRSLAFDSAPLAEPTRDPRPPAVRLSSSRPAAGARRRAPVRRRAGRRLDADHARPAEPHAPRRPRPSPGRSSPAAATGSTCQLNAIGQIVPAGHRLRLAVSTAYWPWAWPSPEPVTLTVHGGALELPVRGSWQGEPAPEFAEPEQAPVPATETLAPGARRPRRLAQHRAKHVAARAQLPGLPHALRRERHRAALARAGHVHDLGGRPAVGARPLRALGDGHARRWEVSIEARSTMQADGESFLVTAEVRAFSTAGARYTPERGRSGAARPRLTYETTTRMCSTLSAPVVVMPVM